MRPDVVAQYAGEADLGLKILQERGLRPVVERRRFVVYDREDVDRLMDEIALEFDGKDGAR